MLDCFSVTDFFSRFHMLSIKLRSWLFPFNSNTAKWLYRKIFFAQFRKMTWSVIMLKNESLILGEKLQIVLKYSISVFLGTHIHISHFKNSRDMAMCCHSDFSRGCSWSCNHTSSAHNFWCQSTPYNNTAWLLHDVCTILLLFFFSYVFYAITTQQQKILSPQTK